MNKKKTSNPLYVVKNNGKDVEAAKGIFELILKKLNLEPAFEFLSLYLKALLEQVNNYAALQFVNAYLKYFFEQIFTKFQGILKV